MEGNKATMMTNQEQCVFCLLTLSPPQQTAVIKEKSVFRKFCKNILPPETLDELRTIPGNEFETTCKDCGQKLLSFLRINDNVIEEQKRISALCSKILDAIQDLVEEDGSLMLRKLKKAYQDPLKSVITADFTPTTASNVVIRKGMEKATAKFVGRLDRLKGAVTTVKKLMIGFVVETETSSRTEMGESHPEERPLIISSTVSMANRPAEIPHENEDIGEMDIDIGPVLPVALKTEPSLDNDNDDSKLGDEVYSCGGNPSIVEVEAVLIKTEEIHELRSRTVNRYDKVIVDPSRLPCLPSTVTNTSKQQNEELVDLCSSADNGEDAAAHLPSSNAPVADADISSSTSFDRNGNGDFSGIQTATATLNGGDRSKATVTEEEMSSEINATIVSTKVNSPTVQLQHRFSSSEVSVTATAPIFVGESRQIMIQERGSAEEATLTVKMKKSGIPGTPHPKEKLRLLQLPTLKAKNDDIDNPKSKKVRKIITILETSSEHFFNPPATRSRKRKLPQTLPLLPPPPRNAAAAGKNGVGNPKRSKSEEKQETITKSPFEIDYATLLNIKRELITAVADIDVEKTKLLLQSRETQEILKRSTSPEYQGKWGNEYKNISTLIHTCVQRSSKIWDEDPKMFDLIEIIEALTIVNKALLEVIDGPYQDTPILTNGVGQHLLEKLIEFGANPFAVDLKQRSCLHKLPFSSQLCKFLIKEHPKIISRLVKMKDSRGSTPLLSFLKFGIYNDDDGEYSNILQIFRNAGADFNAIDSQQNSPLSLAIQRWLKLSRIRLIISFGGSLSWKGEKNQSLLHLAVKLGRKEVVRFLIKEKVFNINVQDDGGLTPLDYLAFKTAPRWFPKRSDGLRDKNRYFEIGIMLKQCGGNFHTKANNEHDQSLLHFAAAEDAKYYEDLYRGWKVELFLRLGFTVNGKDKEGNTPLHFVCKSISRVNSLSRGQQSNRKSQVLAQLGFWLDKKETMKILLRSGANPNAINKIGNTPREMLPDNIQQWQRSEIDELLIFEMTSKKDEEKEKVLS